MVMGSPYFGIVAVSDLVEELDAVIFSIDYGLAPECQGLEIVEDCYAALHWLASNPSQLNIDPSRIMVAGVSAGGGLAAGVALMARDRQGPRLCAQLLMCPMLDDRCSSVSAAQFEEGPVFHTAWGRKAWSWVLGEQSGEDGVSPHVAPGRATNLSDLPEAYIDAGSAEVFRDEAVVYAGKFYNSFVPELSDARFGARAWMHKYNTYFPSDPKANADSLEKERFEMLQGILGHVGKETYIEPPFRVDYGANISLGERFYAGYNLTILDCAIVTIGDRVMLGPNVSIFAATHEIEVQSRKDNIEFAKPITIGNDCWIGGHSIILPGVTIGDGCTIAAGAVVTKDVPSWSVVMGVPGRVVKKVAALEGTA
ncbi:related to E.coli galactoside O-acetyltransferase [Cephalotrichum gorgonifer]|uniref:Related to E.coli galactoside O-acetyltransferase n=1 Tax=Cephalotrichum gorgonifer TaxID=2041049 RepID=A0AAE8N7A8_9PEZI|nr:related to E.coli galactoside O-acetyltransferase [Cephalotrichum gorgonifer]